MIKSRRYSPAESLMRRFDAQHGQRGATLTIAILMLGLLSAVALSVLAVVSGNAKIAGSDLRRTEACYASAAAIEIMTNDFSALFAHTSRPSPTQLKNIELDHPTALISGFTFPEHTIAVNTATLAAMGPNPKVTIPYGPFGGLIASLKPYTLTTTAKSPMAECKLTREMNNYLIPLFQFGMFSDKDIELHPGPDFTFNGRVHANGNIYVNGSVKFLAKVTTANELVVDLLRNGSKRTGATVSMRVGSVDVNITKGSMTDGPNIPAATASPEGQRGYFPGSPDGSINTSWATNSIATAANNTPNQFGGELLTRITGAAPLKLPLQLDKNPTRELIKRRMPNDSPVPTEPSALSESRYHSKSAIRILIDDEVPGTTDEAGIPSLQGVTLSTFDPMALPNALTSAEGGRALWRVNDVNTAASDSYAENTTTAPFSFVMQQQDGTATQANTVRSVKAPPPQPALKNITLVEYRTPIRVTVPAHGFSNDHHIVISGVTNITNANNTLTNPSWTIKNVTATTFELFGSTRNGSGVSALSGKAYSHTEHVNALPKSYGTFISPGAGIKGRILIQIVSPTGVVRDVTKEILSMGMTAGEPNAIVMLQRPLWAAFTQGSRDSSTASPTPNPVVNGDSKYSNTLTDIVSKTHLAADGAIRIDSTNGYPTMHADGFLTKLTDVSGQQPVRTDLPPTLTVADWGSTAWNTKYQWNSIVPINIYNVREGHLTSSMTQNTVYERGITSVVEINMRNLARWMDGVYDMNLLSGTGAVSANIAKPDGFVVYVSDRRGDNVNEMVDLSGATIDSTNGMADNIDIYGQDDRLDGGEDVQSTTAQIGDKLSDIGLKDITELPDPVALAGTSGASADARIERAISVAAWPNTNNLFRRSVRLFNGEDLQFTGVAPRISSTVGITVATENMVYIWGNYNTTGINRKPADGLSSLNDATSTSRYTGNQVPASIVADAFFPLSKTWFDSMSSLYPDDYGDRPADRNLPSGVAGEQMETSVRAGIIAGNPLSAIAGTPDADNDNDSRLSGGMHNFPRFQEDWLAADRRWNFVGSFVPLYYSTQALGPWWYLSTGTGRKLYGAPLRNWAFDTTFLQLDRLPPGTPMFQYISPTAFRQVL